MSRKLLPLGIAAGILIPNVVLAGQIVMPQNNNNTIGFAKNDLKN